MATRSSQRIPSVSHPLRIVPLHVPPQPLADSAALAVAPIPNLTYRNGPLLTAVEVFTIFWGAAWETQQANTAKQLNAFFDFILTSALLDQLAEYSVPGKSIGRGSRVGTDTITSPAPSSSVSDAEIQSFLQHELAANGGLPAATPNTLYFVFLPPGVTVGAFGGKSCRDFCGYHDAIQSQTFYAVMPFPGCSGCKGGLSQLDALTTTVSHELSEAITDPVPGQGWYDDTNGEIGDICAWQSKTLGAYKIQLEWSNKAGRCV